MIITQNTFDDFEKKLIQEFEKWDLPYIVVYNKIDAFPPHNDFIEQTEQFLKKKIFLFSTVLKNNIDDLLTLIKQSIPESAYRTPALVGDLIQAGDIVMLITPIDVEAPEAALFYHRYKLYVMYSITTEFASYLKNEK